MPRSSTAKSLIKLIESMRPTLNIADIDDPNVNVFIVEIDKKTEEQIVDYYDKIKNLTLRGGAYHDLMSVYGLKPKEWWDNMAMFEETDLREHKLLLPLAKKLKKVWKELHVKKKKQSPKPDVVEETA